MTLVRRDLGCGNRERALWISELSSSGASHCFCAFDLALNTFSVTKSSSMSKRAECCDHLPPPALLRGSLLSGPMTPISCARKEKWGEKISQNHDIMLGQKGDKESLQLTLSLRQAAAAAYRSASSFFEAKPSSSILQGHSTVTVAFYRKETIHIHNLLQLYIDVTIEWKGLPLRLLL